MDILRKTRWSRLALLLGLALFASMALIACSEDDEGEGGEATATEEATGEATATATEGAAEEMTPLRIGYLADFSGALAEFGPAIQTGVDLAVKHINEAGGVHGMPVEVVVGDDQTDPTAATEEARRLIEVEGVSAIVGPLASGVAIAVAEGVAVPAGVVVISPSATSPGITTVDDDGFLFRSTTSDAAQGVVLAQLAEDEGLDNVGVLYLNGAYGQGLADVFEANFDGTVTSASFEDAQASYLAELQAAAAGGSDTLIAIGYPEQAQVFIREALENELFSNFLFVDGTKSEQLIEAIGAEALEGFKGTAPTGGPETDAYQAWEASYIAEYGEVPELPYIREAYDAVIAIALAAEAAGSNDGAAIRDQLAAVGGPDGEVFLPGPEGVAAALAAVAAGTDIDYEGAATTLNWNEAGDVTTGYIQIFQYSGGAIVELEVVPFDLSE
ncbi:MAG: ABC transporter substrate-binding protein [Dehalococcoidia bacterium]